LDGIDNLVKMLLVYPETTVKWHLAVQKIIGEVVGVQHVVVLHPLPWLALVVPLL
jgi:hypothetical protein